MRITGARNGTTRSIMWHYRIDQETLVDTVQKQHSRNIEFKLSNEIRNNYPLVICYIAIENDHRNSGFSH